MEPITRRRALQLGALGALGAAAGGVGLSRTGLPWTNPSTWSSTSEGARVEAVPGGELLEPEVLRSQDGVLRVDLVAEARVTEVAGRRAQVRGCQMDRVSGFPE